jgi:cation:H+ antiporter
VVTSSVVMLAGIACAVLGGDLFVRGVVSLAAWWRVPAGIIGATVAAFATSSPELSVAVSSATRGSPEIALGDALGSNVVNIGVVLGVALAFSAITVDRGVIVRDLPMALAAPAVLGLLGLDGTVSRVDAGILMVMFAGWLIQTTLAARHARDAVVAVLQERTHARTVLSIVAGLALLVVAGQLIVASASGISDALGWDGFVVGAIFVALGTSTPEIATMLAARIRKHDEVGVGTVLGSNIFNTLLIVGTAALISPIEVARTQIEVGILTSMLVVVFAIPGRSFRLGRWRSAPLVAAYLAMVAFISAGSGS